MSGLEVRLEHAALRYEGLEMLFDATIGAGSFCAVIGPSGAGKTTLLNLVAGFETPCSGRVLIGGRDMTRTPPAQRPVSMIFQENNLFAHLDVATNIALGISPTGRISAADEARIEAVLERTGLAGLGHRLPAELSGGQRQRVAIARAVLRERPVMLLDEPFAALGPALRAEMLRLIADIHAEKGFTTVLVTHEPNDALHVARDALFIHEGRILFSGAAQQLFAGAESMPELAAYLGPRTADTPRASANGHRK